MKFIGPTAASIEMMGSKTRARQAMEKAAVPFVPGTSKGLESVGQAEQVAGKIGYPVMLKAAAGGGGKGMRLVHTPGELKAALEAAQSEAERAFGDREVYIEKAILNPRHIEVQVLADEYGNTVYLGERQVFDPTSPSESLRGVFRLHRSLTRICGSGWARSRFGGPGGELHQRRTTVSFWSTQKGTSIFSR